MQRTTTAVAETRALAGHVAAQTVAGDLIVLLGDLGAGKTAFVKGLERRDSVRDEESAVAWFYRLLRNDIAYCHAPPPSSSFGSPTPSIMLAASECTGAMVTTTSNSSAAAVRIGTAAITAKHIARMVAIFKSIFPPKSSKEAVTHSRFFVIVYYCITRPDVKLIAVVSPSCRNMLIAMLDEFVFNRAR